MSITIRVLDANGAIKGIGATGATGATGAAGLAGLVLLEEHTAASSATLDATTRNKNGYTGATFQADFDVYVIEFINVKAATDNVTARLRVSTDGGATFDATSGNYRYGYTYRASHGASGSVGSEATNPGYVEICGNLNDTGPGICGSYDVYNPLSASLSKYLQGSIGFLHNDTHYYKTDVGAWYVPTTAINAIRVVMSSGNIASGTLRVYGVSK